MVELVDTKNEHEIELKQQVQTKVDEIGSLIDENVYKIGRAYFYKNSTFFFENRYTPYTFLTVLFEISVKKGNKNV